MKNARRHPAEVLLALALMSGPALAALGGSAGSVDADRQQMHASALRSSTGSSYTVHEYTLDSGTVVREYAQSGTVFAVSWEGPVLPNLQQLLGPDHFTTFTAAARSRGRSGGPLVLQQSGLVLRSTGHMRAFAGQAYLPGQLPQGVSIDDIR
ncbi:DUF2844 domain-containing protein [Xylophilus sp. ASV27]|uniref:DUF2844 domain-containing protein n=1 Tax=Xylophilus sp. ASV27 TaxID=2795129 RepID=UPI0018EB1707|nr:DUF2844 domain-containing protein [Xylophilus sp. ASV27]